MNPPFRARTALGLSASSLVVLLAAAAPAHAGISYTLDRAAATPGTTVRVQAVYFNDGSAGARWQPPGQLILQWRAPNGQIIRTPAQADSDARDLNIPVNNFARMSWSAVVPAQARGLQAVSIEGEPALMALDTGAGGTTTVASRPATGPVVDPTTGQPVPAPEVVAAGASPTAGPAPTQMASTVTPADPNRLSGVLAGLSEYQPMYFDIRTRDRTTARFQVSFKYRLFTPDSNNPSFWDKLYLGYTQTSLWDLQGDSVPFIDTTFNPSLFWLNDNVWTSQSQNWRVGMQGGVEHSSNGKAGADSRSVNDAFVQPSLNYRFDGGSTLSFSPRIKAYFAVADENSNYRDYAGNVDWNLRWAQDNGLIASAMYRQGASSRRTTQLDLAWPLQRTWLNMNGYIHLQYFNGYGETLLGYDQRHRSQIGIGFSLVQ